MQLVAYGAQDIYLTGNPQITFFKVVYRRHTNFSMELIEQTLNGTVASGARLTATVSRNGDLVHRLYANWNPNATFATTAGACYPSFTLLKEIEVEIGGQKIDKIYGHWMTAQHELFEKNSNCLFPIIMSSGVSATDGDKYATAIPVGQGAGAEIGFPPTMAQKMGFHCKVPDVADDNEIEECSAWVALPFWFCRNPGLALPLIALQYHEVKVIMELCTTAQLATGTTGNVANTELKLWAEYIYLDTDERRRFAQVSHEYLIEQLQFQNSTASTSIDLNFNHPVKELIFSAEKNPASGGPNGSIATHARITTNESGNASMRNVAQSHASGCAVGLKLNGHERFTPQHLDYFTRTQVWQHHTGNGGVQKTDSLAVYSFALKPEEHQPSGTCNFSRIDNAQLTFSKTPQTTVNIRIYAVNYNVLRIMSGMGGLAYSN